MLMAEVAPFSKTYAKPKPWPRVWVLCLSTLLINLDGALIEFPGRGADFFGRGPFSIHHLFVGSLGEHQEFH
jgi:hypothetical protein